ncbi:hypothetical protein CEP54_011057 [Fusarium duplospermum]|uniref:DUF7708 domain-containing protein n=1 Tax=Fusarium duplospermum TaxID=1325734 RepID=A0A428PGN3_9HYPO|nr:hypothetical protein CEP54_011057 [Fusarium duplospermum]
MPQDMKENVVEVVRAFSSKDMDKLQRSDQRQKHLREDVKLGRKFTKEEQSALEIDSKEAFEAFWQTTLGGKVDFDAAHEHGVGRASKRANSLAASAYTILQDMSPMVEIVKNFGSPYGSMAIGTICFVFAVSKNRVRMEEQINSTFLNIQDRLPGVNMYRHIYNEEHELDQLLQSKIVDAYDGFINFCMAALEFYTAPRYRRMLWALTSTGKLDEEVARVQESIVGVRLVCEDLLNKNVNVVKTRLEEVRNQNIGKPICGPKHKMDRRGTNSVSIGDLQRQLTELQNDRDLDKLEEVRSLLRIEAPSDEVLFAQLRNHQSNVAAEFQPDYSFSEKTPSERLSMVKDDKAYKEWLSSQRSGMFILSGENHVNGATHCWVSPVALDLIEELVREPDTNNANLDPCVFYLLGQRDTNETCSDVLTFLIIKLLAKNKAALHHEEKFAELRSDFQAYLRLAESHKASEHEVQRGLDKVTLRVVNMFGQNRTIWIVLDRVDQCKLGPRQRSASQRRGGPTLLRSMVHLVEQAVPRVKVLAVVNKADWPVEDQVDELDQQRKESVVIRTFHELFDMQGF